MLSVAVPWLVAAFVELGTAVDTSPEPFEVGRDDVYKVHDELEFRVTRTRKPISVNPFDSAPEEVMTAVALPSSMR